jgi:hypothetical protein
VPWLKIFLHENFSLSLEFENDEDKKFVLCMSGNWEKTSFTIINIEDPFAEYANVGF